MLPEWMAQPVSPRAASLRRRSAVGKFLRDSARFLETTLFLERTARLPGWLQRLHARVKLLTVVGLLIAATFLHHLLSVWILALFAIVALWASRIGPRVVFHRALWIVPALFILAAIPAIFSFITPGRPLLTIVHSPAVSITYPGAAGAGLFISRIITGVLLALLLSLMTRAQEVLKAAYTTVTAPFVYVLTIMYQHIFLLLRTVEELHLAKRARTIAPSSPAEERRWVGRGIAFVFRRTRQQTEEVYQAMQARGYTGHPRALGEGRFSKSDAGWMVLCALVVTGALILDRIVLRSWSW